MKSLQGHFLIAAPQLTDPNFYKAVVLMIKHDEEGALGLILNRPTENTVADVWKLVAEADVVCDKPIFVGGPVTGPLVALHRIKTASEREIMRGLHFAATKEKLQKVISEPKKASRFFTGYSGWGEGQLEDELKAGGWLTMKAKSKLVFHEADDLWEIVVRTIGEQIMSKTLKVKHVPENPSLN
jgi:putative transcriptional regulator